MKEAIKKTGLTQVAFAEKLGVSINTVWRWCADKQGIPDSKKRKIRRKLPGKGTGLQDKPALPLPRTSVQAITYFQGRSGRNHKGFVKFIFQGTGFPGRQNPGGGVFGKAVQYRRLKIRLNIKRKSSGLPVGTGTQDQGHEEGKKNAAGKAHSATIPLAMSWATENFLSMVISGPELRKVSNCARKDSESSGSSSTRS